MCMTCAIHLQAFGNGTISHRPARLAGDFACAGSRRQERLAVACHRFRCQFGAQVCHTSELWTYMYTHTHIYAYIYTCMHTYTHVHTHTCKSIRTRKDVHACSIHTYKQLKSTRTQTRIHVCTHTYTHIYIYTYIHTYLHKHIHPYMHARIHADKCVCVRQRWMAPFLTT